MLGAGGGSDFGRKSLQHAVAWLLLGLVGASCGGRSTEILERDGADGASGNNSGAGKAAVGASGARAITGSGGSTTGVGGGSTATSSGGRGGSGPSTGGRGALAGASGHGGKTSVGGGGFKSGVGGSWVLSGGKPNSAGSGAVFDGGAAGEAIDVGGSGARGGVAGIGGHAGGVAGTAGGVAGATGGSSGGFNPFGSGGGAGSPPVGVVAATASVLLSPPMASVAGSRGCNAGTTGGWTYVLGSLPNPLVDGYRGAQVSCSIASPGNGMLNVTIAISGVDSNGGLPAAVSFTSQITDAGAPAQMTFFSPDTGHLYTLQGSPSCTIQPGFEVGGGLFYGNISCPLIGATDDTSTGCEVSGTIAAENCTTD